MNYTITITNKIDNDGISGVIIASSFFFKSKQVVDELRHVASSWEWKAMVAVSDNNS